MSDSKTDPQNSQDLTDFVSACYTFLCILLASVFFCLLCSFSFTRVFYLSYSKTGVEEDSTSAFKPTTTHSSLCHKQSVAWDSCSILSLTQTPPYLISSVYWLFVCFHAVRSKLCWVKCKADFKPCPPPSSAEVSRLSSLCLHMRGSFLCPLPSFLWLAMWGYPLHSHVDESLISFLGL